MKSKKTKRIIIIVVLILIAGLIMPYVKAELLTAKYGEDFSHEYEQSGMIEQIEYFKVTSYIGSNATVFYVLNAHSAGVLIDFVEECGEWTLVDWRVVWSTSGSADSFCWPYYR